MSECQWFGVAMEMASSSLSSSALRMSWTQVGAFPHFSLIGALRDANSLESGSIR